MILAQRSNREDKKRIEQCLQELKEATQQQIFFLSPPAGNDDSSVVINEENLCLSVEEGSYAKWQQQRRRLSPRDYVGLRGSLNQTKRPFPPLGGRNAGGDIFFFPLIPEKRETLR